MTTLTSNEDVARLQEEIAFLEIENKLFESYLHNHLDNSEIALLNTRRRDVGDGDTLALATEDKLKILNTVMTDTKDEIDASKSRNEKLLQTLIAVLEETDVRIAELRKEAYEFKRDVVVGGENPRTGKVMGEKVLRYVEDKLRQKDASIEKLKLKNASMKSQIKKLQQQLRDKEEMGDVLHYIDFHQLQIENKQNVAKIEKRNKEVIAIKMSTGNIVTSLNEQKKSLIETEKECEWLKGELKSRRLQLKKLEEETLRVSRVGERQRRDEDSKQINEEEEGEETSPETPQLMDYIRQKAEVYELQSEVKDWKRKIEVGSISLTTAEKRMVLGGL